MMKKLLFLAILLFVVPCHAAVYFIDYVGGDNTNNGTASGTPFQHCPGDPRASDNADITLSAGDTVVFKGGVTYEFASGDADSHISANQTGSSGNIITYISGHVYGTPWPNANDRAIIDGTNANLNYGSGRRGVLDLEGRSYITVQGLKFQNNTGTGDPYLGDVAWDGGGSSAGNIIVDDILVIDTNTSAVIFEGCANGLGCGPVTIQNSDLSDSNDHLIMTRYEINGVNIIDNVMDLAGNRGVSPVANCIALTYDSKGGATVLSDVVIRGNTLSDNCVSKNKGLVLIQEDITTMLIEDNTFNCMTNTGCINIASITSGVTIRNNVFHGGPDTNEGILRFMTDQGDTAAIAHDDWDIFNNTFVCDVENPPSNGIIHFDAGNETDTDYFTNFTIKNNILDTDTASAYDAKLIWVEQADLVDWTTFTIDYNAYYGVQADNDFFHFEGTDRTLAEWKSDLSGAGASGNDANSNWGQVTFANEAGDDFTLNSGDTIALDEGTDLTAEGFSDDKNGYVRTGTWDIGAYEFYNTPTCAVTGTITPSSTEDEIVTGGKTIILTLTNDTWVATVGADNAITTALISGIDSNKSEAAGWDAVAKGNMVFGDVTRDSATQVTILMGAEATFDISESETVTVTVPATAVSSATEIVATPTFQIGTVTPPGPLYPEIGLMGGTCSGCSM